MLMVVVEGKGGRLRLCGCKLCLRCCRRQSRVHPSIYCGSMSVALDYDVIGIGNEGYSIKGRWSSAVVRCSEGRESMSGEVER